jgi:exodeoxyribonuclease X
MIIIADTETTGREPPEVIELAWIEIVPGSWLKGSFHFQQFFKPLQGSAFGALSTHHILDEELVNQQPSVDAKIPKEVRYMIGHNVDYDWEALGKPDVRRICTLAIARSMYPSLDSHKLGALVYAFSSNHSETRAQLKNAHSAMADVAFTHTILQIMLLEAAERGARLETSEDLWKFSERCRIPSIITFGKYKGHAIKDLPRDYKMWCLRQPDFDPYVLKAMKDTL